jgi:hypothetical protein
MALALYAKIQLIKLDISFIRKIDEKVLLSFMWQSASLAEEEESAGQRRELMVWGCSQLTEKFDEYAAKLSRSWKVSGRIPKLM